MITLQNISFSYVKGLNILKEISLSVGVGEFVGILGPNGSGKTTLLKIIVGAIQPDEGKVFLEEKPIAHIKKKDLARTTAVVAQENPMPFPFSAMEIVLMGRAPYFKLFGFETPRDIEIARQAMTATDTIAFAERNIQELSGGERQRVIVARALAQEPKLILMDEPTAFLDIKHQTEIYRLIKEKNVKEGLTVVTVLHDINLASVFCDRIVFLKNGRIAADGKVRDVVTFSKVKEVFDTEVYVGINDLTGMPYYVPFTSYEKHI